MKGNFIVLKILFISIARSHSQQAYYNAAPSYAYASTYTAPSSYSPYQTGNPQQSYTYDYPSSAQAGNHATYTYSSDPTGTNTYTSFPQQAYSYEYPQSVQAGDPGVYYSSYPTGTNTYTSSPQQAYSYEYSPSALASYPATSSYSTYPTGISSYASSTPSQATFEYPSKPQAGKTIASLPVTGSNAGPIASNSLGSHTLSNYGCVPYQAMSVHQQIPSITKDFQSYGHKSLSPNQLAPFSYDTSQLSALSLPSAVSLQNYSPILGANSFMGTANGNLQAASLMSSNNLSPLSNPSANTNLLNPNMLSNGLIGLNSPTVGEASRTNTLLNDFLNVAVGSQAVPLNTKNIGTENQKNGKNDVDPTFLKKYKAAKIKALDRHIRKTVSKYVEDAIKRVGENEITGQNAILASTNESDFIDDISESLSGQNTHIDKGIQKITVDHSSNANPGHLSVTLSGAPAKNIDIRVHNQDKQVAQCPTECNLQCCNTNLANDNLVNSAHYNSNLSDPDIQQIINDSHESPKEATKTVNVLVIGKKETNIGNTLSDDRSNTVITESKKNEIINNLNENTVVANVIDKEETNSGNTLSDESSNKVITESKNTEVINNLNENTLASSQNDIDVIDEAHINFTVDGGSKTINKRFIDEDPLDETAIY